MAGVLEELAFDLSMQGLSRQEHSLEDLRTRAGTLLAASSVVSSFLGATALNGSGMGWISGLALAAFVLSILSCISILVPARQFRLAPSGSALLDESRHHDRDVPLVHRRLAYWIDEVVENNQRALDRLFRFYQLAAVSLVGAVILWVIAIAT